MKVQYIELTKVDGYENISSRTIEHLGLRMANLIFAPLRFSKLELITTEDSPLSIDVDYSDKLQIYAVQGHILGIRYPQDPKSPIMSRSNLGLEARAGEAIIYIPLRRDGELEGVLPISVKVNLPQ